LEETILSVVRSGQWILGPAVKEFEENLAAFCGANADLDAASQETIIGAIAAFRPAARRTA
jgi:dTDP-4-amino-4,6-dideoxygalactose transaminase